ERLNLRVFTDEGNDVNEQPCEEAEQSAKVYSVLEEVCYRVALPYDGHVATIEIPERFHLFPFCEGVEVPCQCRALLLRRLRELGVALGISRVGELNADVADGVDVVVTDDLVILVRDEATVFLYGLGCDALKGACFDARRPDERRSVDPAAVGKVHRRAVEHRDELVQVYVYAKACEDVVGFLLGLGAHGTEKLGSAVYNVDFQPVVAQLRVIRADDALVHFSEHSGHLDACWSAAGNHDGQEPLADFRVFFNRRTFKHPNEGVSHGQRIGNFLQLKRPFAQHLVAEEICFGSCRDYQDIVLQDVAIGQDYLVGIGIDG